MARPPPPLPRLLRYARSSRRTIVLATTWSVVNKLFDLAPPFLIGAAVDVVINRSGSIIGRLGFPDLGDQLWFLAIATIVIWPLESIFEYAAKVWWRNLAQTIQHDLRAGVYRNVQRLDLAYFEDRSTGGLLSVLSDDVNQLERFLDGGAHELVQIIVTALAIGASFFILAPELAWLAMLPVPFVIWGSIRFQRLVAPRYVVVRERVGTLNAILANNVGGIATIQSFGTEAHEAARVDAESEAYRQANRRAIRVSSAFSPLIRMVIVVGFGVSLIYGGHLALEGRLAVGSYSAMVFLIQRPQRDGTYAALWAVQTGETGVAREA
jgi:ATP-binding cassette subfamily B protein